MSTKYIVVIAIVLIGLFLFAILLLNRDTINQTYAEFDSQPDDGLIVEIIPAPDDTYGYNIIMNGRVLIHQPAMPAVPGIRGFKTEEGARLVGEFVAYKIRNDIFPPSVTVAELDSLGVMY